MDSGSNESEVIAQELSVLGQKFADLERRMAEVEKVNARLEEAALITARALQEISGHWDAVYEAMRRRDTTEQPSAGEVEQPSHGEIPY